MELTLMIKGGIKATKTVIRKQQEIVNMNTTNNVPEPLFLIETRKSLFILYI